MDIDDLSLFNVLCDICEAVIGAIYIDSDINSAIAFVEHHWKELFNKDLKAKKDFKTSLQEKLHKLKEPFPVYETAEKTGSEHSPLFKIRVSCADGRFAYGEGHNKKEAEQAAAEKLLKLIEEKQAEKQQKQEVLKQQQEKVKVESEDKDLPKEEDIKTFIVDNEIFEIVSKSNFTDKLGCYLVKNSNGYA